MSEFSHLTRDEVFAALGDDSSPVPIEVERLMICYSDALASGADPYETILPGPDTPAIESVAMFLLHEALGLGDDGEESVADVHGGAEDAPSDGGMDAAIAAADKRS